MYIQQSLILTSAWLLFSSIASVAAESAIAVHGIIETIGTIRTAAATFTIENDDLFNMPSFIFTGMASDENDDDNNAAAFTKIKATKRIMDSVSEEIVWEGTITESDRVGFATLVRIANGDVAGHFSTETTTYSLLNVPDGTLQIRAENWADFPEEEEEEGSSASLDLPSIDAFTAEVSVEPDTSGETTTSKGKGTAIEGPNGRMLRTGDGRKLPHALEVIDVLVLITNRAMCEYAGLSYGCAYSDSIRSPIESRLSLLQSETNSAMQGVGANVKIRIVGIKFLGDDFDGYANSGTLSYIGDDVNVQAWRDELGADLVAMITGGGGGMARVNGFQSATGYRNFNVFTFTHELGHNLGCLHNRADSTQDHLYSHGLQVPNVLRTVMAYSCSSTVCPRIPFFSASGYSHSGVSIGDSEHDNARLISEKAAAVAAWRPTVSPPQEADISTDYDQYNKGEDIVISFEYSDPQVQDWVGFYAEYADPAHEEPVLWLYTCGTQHCGALDADGTLTFGYGDPIESETGSFPLLEGNYIAVLGRNAQQPYDILASTSAFQVSEDPWVDIYTMHYSHDFEEDIVVAFEYSDPQNQDWVGIYNYDIDPVHAEPLLWLYTCGTQRCRGSDSDGTLTFGYGRPNESEASHFPLSGGTYVALLGRNPHQPYDILGRSEFVVDD